MASKNPDWPQIVGMGFVFGMFSMGVVMTHAGKNSPSKVSQLKAECELNIPRNQECVMQFVPGKPNLQRE